eukprot:359178-Chlamydomonas_euryale.AAC.3
MSLALPLMCAHACRAVLPRCQACHTLYLRCHACHAALLRCHAVDCADMHAMPCMLDACMP